MHDKEGRDLLQKLKYVNDGKQEKHNAFPVTIAVLRTIGNQMI
jgi:hypothetical protein